MKSEQSLTVHRQAVGQTKTQELIAVCQALIQAKSYSGQEDQVVAVLQALFAKHGYDSVEVDEYGSIIAGIKGKRPGPRILLDAHIDTVPVPDPSLWKHDPFGVQLDDGRIYGRGTSDMKGALAAMLVAVADFAHAVDRNFAGELFVSGVVHEECFEGIAARSISQRVRPDFVIIGEASELNIKCGQRGRAEIVVETFGVPAHSANPDKGVNAVYRMASLINSIRELSPPKHPLLGLGILELTDIKSSPYPGASVVPDYCRATYDRRLLVGESPESVLQPLTELVERCQQADPTLKARVSYAVGSETCHTGATISGSRFFPGWVYAADSDFVAHSHQALLDLGIPSVITQYSFCTNGSHYAGEAGIRTLGFGPSRENLAHTIDEYVEVEQLAGAYRGYQVIVDVLSKLPAGQGSNS